MHDEYVENLEERLCEEIKQLIFGEYESKTVYLSNILKRYDIKIDVRKKRDDDKSIDDLELSVRAYNYLKRAGINTLGELKQDLEDDTLIKVKCLDEVLELIQTDNGDGFETLSIIIDGQKTIYKYSTQDEEKETLFVRTLYFNTKFTLNEVLKHWMEFMMKSVYINAYDRQIVSYGKSNYDLIEYLNSNGTKQINEFFDKYNFEQNIEYVHASQGKLTSVKIDDDENQKYIFYKRKGINEPIPFVEEALGNQNLLYLERYFVIFCTMNILRREEISQIRFKARTVVFHELP